MASDLTLITKRYGVLLGDITEAFFMARCEKEVKAVCLTSCCIRTAGVLYNDTCHFVGDGEVEAVSAFYIVFFFSVDLGHFWANIEVTYSVEQYISIILSTTQSENEFRKRN